VSSHQKAPPPGYFGIFEKTSYILVQAAFSASDFDLRACRLAAAQSSALTPSLLQM